MVFPSLLRKATEKKRLKNLLNVGYLPSLRKSLTFSLKEVKVVEEAERTVRSVDIIK